MDYQNSHLMTLTNSIIGVSILAMPYCFKQCGIILSVVMLLFSNVISRLACHFLLKSAIIARRKTFEFLAYHIFGALGKFVIEIGLIGFLIGTCIAFFVVMGDLAPEIISEVIEVRATSLLRTSVLIILAVFCVLPLGLLRNVDSLSGVSKATVYFYCCLVLKIIVQAMPHIFNGDWINKVDLWRPAGILQCLPIFSMALSCQTQLFEIYQVLPNTSLEKMNSLIRAAVNICTWVYIFVGTFGYIAFSNHTFSGNILLSFHPSIMTDLMKLGFVLSLAFSFPLVIFPCRASLYSLMYKGPMYTLYEGNNANYIPEWKFKMLTSIIVLTSLCIGILIPNIELVLGLVGSTIGIMICVLFPVTCFICTLPKNTNERILAQIMLFVGVILMVLGTYANLYAFEEAKLNVIIADNNNKPTLQNHDLFQKPLLVTNKIDSKIDGRNHMIFDIPTTIKHLDGEVMVNGDNAKFNKEIIDIPPKQEVVGVIKEIRHEPPQPEEPIENRSIMPEINIDSNINVSPKGVINVNNQVKKQDPVAVNLQVDEAIKNFSKDNNKMENNDIRKNVEGKVIIAEEQRTDNKVETLNKLKKSDEVDPEAINKEEKELKEQEKEIDENKDTNQVLIDTIQKQNEVQKEIVEQQKKLIEVIQKQQENVNNIDKFHEEKLKAVQQIESIAKKAIESISNQDPNKKAEAPKTKMEEDVAKPKYEKAAKPLSYQLGLHQVKVENNLSQNDLNLYPLPIALAKNLSIKSSQQVKEKSNKSEEKSNRQSVGAAAKLITDTHKVIEKDLAKSTEIVDIQHLERLKREILSEVDKFIRSKTELSK